MYERFVQFGQALKIESKEKGLVPLNLYGGQKYLLDEMISGIREDKRFIIILKCRQMGCSTACLAFDLFWMFTHPGLQGAMITDTDTNRDFFRSILTNYYHSLPKHMKAPVVMHNRNQLEFRNRSRLVYLVAGVRQSGTLGKGKAINFLHATETASWGGGADIYSLMSTLAEEHPARLYLFESTAFGFNDFYDMYQEAKKALRQKAIFVSWWRSPEIYSILKDSKIYAVYGRGGPSGDERIWIRLVREQYGHDITPEQLAWWRYTLFEKFRGDISAALQEFPWVEDDAFQMAGTKFFNIQNLTEAKKYAMMQPYECYRYSFGFKFEDTELTKAAPRTATLRIWEKPRANGHYVLGADPAYGSSDNADRYAIEVFRIYGDKMIQCAEFCTSEMSTIQFAWVIGHLAGYYKNTYVNLEVNGPGEAVLNELNHMKEYSYYDKSVSDDITAVMSQMGYYFYRRIDSLGGATALHWKTTTSTKPRMMNYMRDVFEIKQIEIKSEALLEEMRYISQDGSAIEAAGSAKDDRVMATALAAVLWKEPLQMMLMSMEIYFQENETEESLAENNQVKSMVQHMLGVAQA